MITFIKTHTEDSIKVQLSVDEVGCLYTLSNVYAINVNTLLNYVILLYLLSQVIFHTVKHDYYTI